MKIKIKNYKKVKSTNDVAMKLIKVNILEPTLSIYKVYLRRADPNLKKIKIQVHYQNCHKKTLSFVHLEDLQI